MNNLSELTGFPHDPAALLPLKKRVNKMRMAAKLQSAPTASGNEIWLVTLSDLLMLLLIFFVILFGLTLHQQKNTAAPPPAPLVQAPPAPIAVEQPAISQASSEPAPDEAAGTLAADLATLFERQQGQKDITVARHARHVIVTLPEQIMFDSGHAQLKHAVAPVLEKVAGFIQNHPAVALEIQGHTDDRPISSRRYPSNWELSADRATQVAKALIQLGINPEKISTKGFGEYHPLYPNSSDEGRLKNRRVELQFSLAPT